MDKKEGSSTNFMPDDLLEVICILIYLYLPVVDTIVSLRLLQVHFDVFPL